MDHGSTPAAGTPHLFGIRKTLRRLYAPTLERNDAIDLALAALAQIDRHEPALERPAVLLAPAA